MWWTWVWVNSGSWWWTGRPGMLQSMGSQRVRHNWVTELYRTETAKWLLPAAAAAAAAKSLQSCLTLCNPIYGSPPGSPIPGILQEHWSGLPFPSPIHESEVTQSCPSNVLFFDLGYGYSPVTWVLYSLSYFYPFFHIFTNRKLQKTTIEKERRKVTLLQVLNLVPKRSKFFFHRLKNENFHDDTFTFVSC